MRCFAVALGVVLASAWSAVPNRTSLAQIPVIAAGSENQSVSAGGMAAMIELGEAIVENTSKHPLSKDFVGNSLNCTSCHLDNGRHEKAASFVGIATAYPAWSPRENRVITLQDRVLNCFMRSQNGTRPPIGSKVATAITTYITSLSESQPIKMNRDRPLGPGALPMLDAGVSVAGVSIIGRGHPSVDRGRGLYADHCTSCHGEDGLGMDHGPPVWGPQSYNDGAGLSRVPKLASWLKVAMPLDDPYLSVQEAFDIAAFVNSHERRKFVLQDHLPKADQVGRYNGAISK
jgi:thiosulfate dehydrogenase